MTRATPAAEGKNAPTALVAAPAMGGDTDTVHVDTFRDPPLAVFPDGQLGADAEEQVPTICSGVCSGVCRAYVGGTWGV